MSERSKEAFDRALNLKAGEQLILEFHTFHELESFRVQLARDKVNCRRALGDLADEVIIRKNTRTGHQLIILEKMPILPTIKVMTGQGSAAVITANTDEVRLRKLMLADGHSEKEIANALKE